MYSLSCDNSRDKVRMESRIKNVEVARCRFYPVVLVSSGPSLTITNFVYDYIRSDYIDRAVEAGVNRMAARFFKENQNQLVHL